MAGKENNNTKRCPKCRMPELVERTARGKSTRLDMCPNCKGIWFDRNELEEVLDTAAKELGVLNKAHKTNFLCPACQEWLYQFQYPQTLVTIDMCKQCHGIWLDAGEFEEIKKVREKLEHRGKLETHAPVTGFKGSLIRFIDNAISFLRS